MKRLKALLAEDEALIAYDLEDTLKQAGFEVLGPFATAAEAEERALNEEPDVAVVDLILRDDSAMHLLERLRRRAVPLVIVSGLSAPSDRVLHGAQWLSKPIQPDELLHAIRNAMRQTAKPGPEHSQREL